MDLIDRLKELSARIPKQLDHLQTEEATKNALVMPFIQALGYNVFDPTEVVPEYTADVGTKKGEKVDYVIQAGGTPIILIECKTVSVNLDEQHASQLYRYFSVTEARFGVLTNGIIYRFYSDLDAPNKMDARPFFEFSLDDVDEQGCKELKRFAKGAFDLETILSTASDLKYRKGIKRALAEEWVNPSEEFVRMMAGRVYSGRMTQAVRDQFAHITKSAFHEFLSERINERLKAALETSVGDQGGDEPEATEEPQTIVTTADELEAYYVVKAILAEVIEPKRVFMRDRKTYCGILIDDNNRKTVCRLWFNGSQKYLGLFNEAKEETKHAVGSTDDLYSFAATIRETALRHVKGGTVEQPPE